MLECTDTHACGEVFIHTSDRAVLVHITLPVSRSCVAVSGACAHSSFFLYHLFDDELELVQSCQPLQSCHWMLESPWLRGSTNFLVDENALDATIFAIWRIGMLGGCHGACSTYCCLLPVLRACFSNVHVMQQ